jgi:hypothetical protein
VPNCGCRELEDDIPVAGPLGAAHLAQPVLTLREDVEPDVDFFRVRLACRKILDGRNELGELVRARVRDERGGRGHE